MTTAPECRSEKTVKNPVRVLIVDDSAVIRTVISRTLSEKPGIEIVGMAVNGKDAVQSVEKLMPDIVILDIEMPIMDGLTALPLILHKKPDAKVLICSTLSARGADISVRAMTLGAADCILKPGGAEIVSAHEFQDNLVRLVQLISSSVKKVPEQGKKSEIMLRKPALSFAPQIIAIGSSTGGPTALIKLLSQLNNLPVPIVITQHMPKTFTSILADHITRSCGLTCMEGMDGEIIEAGRAYIAPGGYHMTLEKSGSQAVIRLNQGEPENFCRPSVNPMLRSLLPIYGGRILSVILTGMGNDGSQACAQLVEQGGQVIAQDEKSSVVWGMPGAVANAGLCTAVLPVEELSEWIKRAVRKG